MSVSVDSTRRDPLDTTVTQLNGWMCKICSLEQSSESTYCQMCLYARPLDRRGVPQIFSGYHIHFNGIIARNLIHPSHSVEWRMAQRHGASCEVTFDPAIVNLMIYRPGYERSEKCRLCLEKHTQIPVVPITWMLDSLLQSRQIHLVQYELKAIPAVATVTVSGLNLPHHQHPFYQLNVSDYAIPTSFPVQKVKKTDDVVPQFDINDAALNQQLPPFFDVAKRQHITLNVFDVALMCLSQNCANNAAANVKSGIAQVKSKVDEDVGDDMQEDEREAASAWTQKNGLELLQCQLYKNKIDRMLFTGLTIMLSPSLCDRVVMEVIQGCGGKVVLPENSAEGICTRKPTHIIYARQDKKCNLMLLAAYVVSSQDNTIKLVKSNWLEDCLLLGELVPAVGIYTPTPKLMETLTNKYNRQARSSISQDS